MSNNQTSQDVLMNSYLKLVGEEYARIVSDEFDAIPDDLTYPKSLDQWFDGYNNKIKKKVRKKMRKANAYKYFVRIAAAFVAILIVSTVVTLNVDALRVEFLNFFIEENNESMHIQAGKFIPGDDMLEDYHSLYILDYVPQGFVLEDVKEFNTMVRMYYTYQDKGISFAQYKGEIDIEIDNERSVISEYILPTGESAILSDGDGYSSIIWENNTVTFMIDGDVDKAIIIKIAENIRWKE